jgi:hypothetical protein
MPKTIGRRPAGHISYAAAPGGQNGESIGNALAAYLSHLEHD